MFSRGRTALRGFVVAAACAIAILTAGTAHAVPLRVDEFIIASVPVDFGGGSLNSAGIPSNNGQVDWNVVANQWEPRVIGKIWVSSAPQFCVRLQLVVGFLNGVVATYIDYTSDFCTASPFVTYQNVDFAPVRSPYIVWAFVVLQSRFNIPSAPWETKGAGLLLPAP